MKPETQVNDKTGTPTRDDRRRMMQRLYNQAQPLFTVLGFTLAIFWLAPMAPDTAPPQTIQAGVSK